MSHAIFHFPRYKLARQLRKPGGKTIAAAVNDAQAGLDAIKDDCLATVDQTLLQIDQMVERLKSTQAGHNLMALYEEANSLVGIAATSGLVEMDGAAYSLCDLIDRMTNNGRCDLEPIIVHVRALHLLRRPDQLGQGGAVREILLGLRQVRERYVADETADALSARPAAIG